MTYKYDPNLSCYLSRAAALKRQKNPKENSKRDLLIYEQKIEQILKMKNNEIRSLFTIQYDQNNI